MFVSLVRMKGITDVQYISWDCVDLWYHLYPTPLNPGYPAKIVEWPDWYTCHETTYNQLWFISMSFAWFELFLPGYNKTRFFYLLLNKHYIAVWHRYTLQSSSQTESLSCIFSSFHFLRISSAASRVESSCS